MRQFIKNIPLIFYSSAFYADLVRKGKGIGIGFILLQVALTILVPALVAIPTMSVAHRQITSIFDRFPDVTIKDQKLGIDRTSPYSVDIQSSDKKIASIVFDTSSRERDLTGIKHEMDEQKIVALITSDFIAMPDKSAIKLYNVSDFSKADKSSTVITHEKWVSFGKNLVVWGFPFLFVLTLSFTLIGSLMLTAFKAIVITMMALFCTLKPPFAASMRLAAAAAVPSTLYALLFSVFNQPQHVFIGILIWFTYAIFGLASANKEEKQQTPPPIA